MWQKHRRLASKQRSDLTIIMPTGSKVYFFFFFSHYMGFLKEMMAITPHAGEVE